MRHWFKNAEGYPVGYLEQTCEGTLNEVGTLDGPIHLTGSAGACYPVSDCEGFTSTEIDGAGPYCVLYSFYEALFEFQCSLECESGCGGLEDEAATTELARFATRLFKLPEERKGHSHRHSTNGTAERTAIDAAHAQAR
jgi:hypothetical protein